MLSSITSIDMSTKGGFLTRQLSVYPKIVNSRWSHDVIPLPVEMHVTDPNDVTDPTNNMGCHMIYHTLQFAADSSGPNSSLYKLKPTECFYNSIPNLTP